MIHPGYAVRYVGFIVVELVRGAVTIGADVLTPGLRTTPAIVELPLRCDTDLEITWLASSITITPGTLVVGTAAARAGEPASLFVHAMYARSREQVLGDLRDMESRLLRVTRGRRADDGGAS